MYYSILISTSLSVTLLIDRTIKYYMKRYQRLILLEGDYEINLKENEVLKQENEELKKENKKLKEMVNELIKLKVKKKEKKRVRIIHDFF